MFNTLLIILLGVILIIVAVNLPVHVALKFAFGIAAMYGVSKLIAPNLKIKDEYGMLMLRSNAGLRTINSLAKHAHIWKVFADLGMVLAYGLLSIFIIKRPCVEKAMIMIFGFVILGVTALLVSPFVIPFLLGTLDTQILEMKAANAEYAWIALGLIFFGGFALATFVSLIAYTSVIVSAAIGTIFFGTNELAKTAPGATPLLPGINIPFAEGIIALAIILLVHEGAHAVLSRIARVRIFSSGIVLFGIIPIGAFVEPDENVLAKLDCKKQTRVLVAGSTANLLVSILAFVAFLGFLFITVPYKETGLLTIGGNEHGNIIYKINKQDAAEFVATANDKVKYNTTLVFESSRGTYETKIEKGELRYYDLSKTFFMAKYSNPVLQFVYNLLGLVFSLNFIIGIVNLLPLPFFDGYRILEININQKAAVTALSLITAFAFLLNFLPWLA